MSYLFFYVFLDFIFYSLFLTQSHFESNLTLLAEIEKVKLVHSNDNFQCGSVSHL